MGIVAIRHTNTIDRDIDVRAENLVPAIDLCDEPPRVWPAAGPTEGVGKGSRGREVGL